jgi:glucose-6-phosphate 1-dehydrogenase
MTTKQTRKMATEALKCLRKAVQEELKRKALLGQYVIISRNGKACRVSAKKALKMAKAK